MKRLVWTALILMIAVTAQGQEAPAIARYVPAHPDSRHVFVMDSAHILSPATVAWLQDSAQALQTATGADIAWVTLPTLGGRAIEEASLYIGRTWKVGSAGKPGDPDRNRGLVILYVPDKSTTAGSNFRTEVGTGLQGTITDSRSRAITAAMRDDLRAKHFDDGYVKGWNAAAGLVREDFTGEGRRVAPSHRRAVIQSKAGIIIAIVAFFTLWITVIVVGLLIGRKRRREMRGDYEARGLPIDDKLRNDSLFSAVDVSSGDSGGGGDFGGGGGFDGGGSSDSI